jgi:hypothetical protein
MNFNVGRTINITRDPLVCVVTNFLNSIQSIKIKPGQVELMAWPIGSFSPLHVHDKANRDIFSYHSVLYLNDDYEGGEFYTHINKQKLLKGSLTFFDGQKLMHGVLPVKTGHRWTINFWWVLDKLNTFPTLSDAVTWTLSLKGCNS